MFLLVLLGTMLGTMKMMAQEAYAVYTSNNTTLTFYYDSDRSTHTLSTETVYNLPTGNTQPAWYTDGTYANVTKVSFTSSFSSAQPTSTSYWFYHMSNLTSISNLRYLNTSSVTSMNQMFAYCSGLTSLDLSNFDTGKVTTMQSMFWECTGLTSINMNNFNTEKVTTMYGMFKGCSALTTLDIRYFKTPVLANIQEMFYQCSNLTTIYAGHGWTYGGSDSQVFNGSTKLVGGEGTKYNSTHLDASYARVDGGTSAPGYFTRVPYAVWDSSAKSLTFYDDGKGSEKTGVIYNLNGPNTRPGWDTTEDHTNWEVTKAVFHSSFANARPTSTYLWFAGMDKLTSITGIAYLNTSEVTNMSYMFSGVKLSSLDLSKFDTSKATDMNHMFYRCTELTKLDLTKFKTSKVTNMANMFDGDTNLQTILVTEGWWTTSKVTSSTNMFNECTSLVGGAGTTYDETHVDKSYAHVDYEYDPGGGSTTTPGYLTSYQEYAVDSNNTLTFYYDTEGYKKYKDGEDVYIGRTYSDCDWMYVSSIYHIVFDSSFANNKLSGVWYIDLYCPNVETITGLEYVKTGNLTSMGSMFSSMPKLTTLDLSSFDTRKVTNMNYMFDGCSSLTTIKVGANWSTANVTSSTGMFSNCTSLVGGAGTRFDSNHIDKAYAHVDEGEGNPGYLTGKLECYTVFSGSTLTFYNDAYRSLREGTTYTVPMSNSTPQWLNNSALIKKVVFDSSFDTALPCTGYQWFENCANLETIEGMKQLNTSNMTMTNAMFKGCSKLESLDLSHFNTFNMTSMAIMFSGCTKLKNIDVSSFDMSKVRDCSGMFTNCSSIESLDLSHFIFGSNFGSSQSMFAGCSKLRTIYVSPDWDNTLMSTKGSHMFDNCTSLVGGAGTTFSSDHVDGNYARIDGGTSAPGYFTDITKRVMYAVYTEDNTTLTFYYDGWKDPRTGVVKDLISGGYNRPQWYDDGTKSNVTNVVFDPSFADARPTKTAFWFSDMQKLTTITGIEYLNTSEVTSMADMFWDCYLLEDLDVSGFNTSKVTNMSGMFRSCSKLTNLDLSNFDTRKVTSMSLMFQYYKGKTLDLSNFNTSNVVSMQTMFAHSSNLLYLNLSNFNTANVTNMSYMFNGCTTLNLICVSNDWNIDNVSESTDMFKDCGSIIGGNGTTYNASFVDKEYAVIDGENGNPGYLTRAPIAPYAVLSEDGKTLTFYHDGRRGSKTGTIYNLNSGADHPDWDQDGSAFYVEIVRFDPSFADARPTTTHSWFEQMHNLRTLVNEKYLNTSEVTDMGAMFWNCFSLTSMDISNFDTEKVTTMYGMFNGCSSIIALDLNSFNTAEVTEMNYMFGDCSNLRVVYVGQGWNTDKVTDSNNMFKGCNAIRGEKGTTYDPDHIDKAYAHVDEGTSNPGYLTSAEAYVVYDSGTLSFYCDGCRGGRGPCYDLNNGETYPGWYSDGTNNNVTNVYIDPSFANARPTSTFGWFNEMPNLTDITGMEYLNTSEVTTMAYMFSGSPQLRSVDLTGFNTSKVTDMSFMFFNCQALTSLDLHSFNTQNVRNMSYMFQCTNFDTLDLSVFYTRNDADMRQMFAMCHNLTTIYVGTEWHKVEGPSYQMFIESKKLKGGLGTGYDPANTGGVYAHVDGGTANPGYLSYRPYVIASADRTKLNFYCDGMYARHPQDGETVYSLNQGTDEPAWFTDCTSHNVTKVVLDSSFANTRPTTTHAWFVAMYNITSIEGIQYLNTSEVTDMRSMFSFCQSLENIDVSGFDTQKVTDMGYMFNECNALKAVDVSRFDTKNVTDMDYMFSNCTSLESLDVSSFTLESMESMVWVFQNCTSLKTIYGNLDWNENFEGISNGMFDNCPSLVGGAGTEWDSSNPTDKSFAHIDGGEMDPGYFTMIAFQLGDVNHDGDVNVADVTALVNMLKSGNVVYNEVADVDGDGSITNIDVKALVYNILGSYALMYVEDVFTITGRGTVATGQILKGMFRTGQTAVLCSISDAIADVEFTISGIEKFQQTVDVAVAGDNVGILVPVDKANVQRGDVLTIKNNPELRHGKTVKGTLYVLTKEEGGRHTPFFTGYRPQMYVAGADFTLKCTDLGMVNGSTPEKIMPGDTSENIVFEVVQEDGKTPYVYPGQVVLLREDGRTVGRLTITE